MRQIVQLDPNEIEAICKRHIESSGYIAKSEGRLDVDDIPASDPSVDEPVRVITYQIEVERDGRKEKEKNTRSSSDDS